MENFKQILNTPTQEIERGFFELSVGKGRAYTGAIDKLLGRYDFKNDELIEVDLSNFESAGRNFFKQQSERYIQSESTPKALLEQLFTDRSMPVEFEDESKYELLEPSQGVFILKIDINLLRKIIPGAQAVACRIKDGISFVLVPTTGDVLIDEGLWKENIPHEVHHLFWKSVIDNKLVTNEESDHELQRAFTMYQDELIARACSNGPLSGYSHLSMLNPEEKNLFKKENPEKFDQIINIISEINDFCRDLSEEMTIRNIKNESLIGLIIDAKSFNDLMIFLQKFKDFVITQPIISPERQSTTGWDFI